MRMLIVAGLLASGPAIAQEVPEAGIRSTIDRQIRAFLAEDVETAFGFASDGIRDMFLTPERFGEMVRQGYPMVWRPADWSYLDLREINGNLYQQVLVTDQAGRLHVLEYAMIRTDQGWRIRGVQILRMPEVGA